MCRLKDYTRLDFRKLRVYPDILSQVVRQGLPTGVQNAVISIGNLVVQSNINAFGEFAMSGHGAYAKIEGLVFLPITAMSMSLPTFVSQNLGARQYDRAKKGAIFGILSGMVLAELVGMVLLLTAPPALRFFVDEPEAIQFGAIQVLVHVAHAAVQKGMHKARGTLRYSPAACRHHPGDDHAVMVNQIEQRHRHPVLRASRLAQHEIIRSIMAEHHTRHAPVVYFLRTWQYPL